jgi:hypothetical protein
VGRRAPARGRARGGEDIPALPPGARLAAAAAVALAATAALVLYPALAAERLGWVLAAAGIAAGAALVLALSLRVHSLVPVALVLLGGEYTGFLYVHGAAGTAPPVFAAGLVLVAELSYWALEPLSAREEPLQLLARAATVAATSAGAAVLALFLEAVAHVQVSKSLGVEALGVLAAALAVALVVRLARSRV